MTVYQIEVPDDLWEDWKRTVPRGMKLTASVVELIEADLNE